MKELLRSCSIKSKLIFSFLFIVLLTVVLDFFAIKSLNEAKEFGQAKVEHLQQRYGRTRRTLDDVGMIQPISSKFVCSSHLLLGPTSC